MTLVEGLKTCLVQIHANQAAQTHNNPHAVMPKVATNKTNLELRHGSKEYRRSTTALVACLIIRTF
jgi:hypothetical protein